MPFSSQKKEKDQVMVVFMLGVSGAVKKYEQNPMSATIKYLHGSVKYCLLSLPPHFSIAALACVFPPYYLEVHFSWYHATLARMG
ncbi:hypothetical protein KY285_014424 [Solanum tuberosum]|nr:hypothetical protein KY285_014424 [Solanum tuberosum]